MTYCKEELHDDAERQELLEQKGELTAELEDMVYHRDLLEDRIFATEKDLKEITESLNQMEEV